MIIAEEAKKGVGDQVNLVNAQNAAMEKINNLSKLQGDDGKRRDEIMARAAEGKTTGADKQWLADKLEGDKSLADALVKNLEVQGNKVCAQQSKMAELLKVAENDPEFLANRWIASPQAMPRRPIRLTSIESSEGTGN